MGIKRFKFKQRFYGYCSVGNAIIYDNILFVDTNNDDITDFVWITTNS
ncbi:hypothetical protein KUL156_16990 [Alteromonas sp. KUL156]|nr:hypothetical protein KUL154_03230 [Alteromonas sp. KUL154]GFD99106.1 hypothetical protein KUL156_16990 [Alteromonas sp. KUL156]